MVEKEAQSDREEMEREVEQSRKQLHARLKEMEMLREALKRLENELRDARENMHIQDRRNTEQNSTLSELRVKVITRGNSCLHHKYYSEIRRVLISGCIFLFECRWSSRVVK